MILPILLVLALVSSVSSHVSAQNANILAEQQVRKFEQAFRDSYNKHGLMGIFIYFTPDFISINEAGQIKNKTEHLKYLSHYYAPKYFFYPQRQAHFDYGTSPNLYVSYYHDQLLWVYTLVPNRALLGGYQVKKLAVASK